ncbi:HD domain-containing protein [Amycolatopsis sp. NPDC051716]|jgi:(p)ppGpp synthase/HD superfamily hydrolase|uniref:HD domain-containing protein n=1 Tax=Amycolatopsis sp. NPDC051716 TaxID=3155804 RepID=UPI0034496A7D
MTTVPPQVAEIAGRYPDADARLVERAYVFAAFWHRGQTRRSGDPYISHPVEVGATLARLGLDAPMVCAGLLHDVVEDTGCPPDQLRTEFGDEIAALVHGLLTLEREGGSWESADRRVLILKLADRLHNMRTIRFVPRAKQERISRETLEVLGPLAGRLGLDTVKAQLEALSLATLYPDRFVARTGPVRSLRVSRRVLAISAVLLPVGARARWLEEWTAELHALPGRRARTRFTVQILVGMVRLSVVLRQAGP